MHKTISLCLLAGAVLTGCADECREFSEFSCSRIEKAKYNAHFYFPDGREELLGQTRNLEQCGDVVHGFAASRGLGDDDGWSYVCCMRAKGSECYEKHQLLRHDSHLLGGR